MYMELYYFAPSVWNRNEMKLIHKGEPCETAYLVFSGLQLFVCINFTLLAS